MPAAEIHPLYLAEPQRELALYMLQRPHENIRPALAMAMAMEAVDAAGQAFWQLVCRNTEARAGRAWVVKSSADL